MVDAEMGLTLLPTDRLYYNVRNHYYKLHSNRQWHATEFRNWLHEQFGATVIKSHSNLLVTDSMGVAPGYDMLEFKSESMATWFVLRWS